MYWLILGALFIQPIYDRAQAKGFNAKVLVTLACTLGIGCYFFSMIEPSPLLACLSFLFPAAVLGGIFVFPANPGAPGKAFLTIATNCSACGAANTFPRSREGTVAMCSSCGEIVRIPSETGNTEVKRRHRIKPACTEGIVWLETFSKPEAAYQVQSALKSHEIESTVLCDDGGGMLPATNLAGYHVAIDLKDWDEAIEV